jgi:hypothetical protein
MVRVNGLGFIRVLGCVWCFRVGLKVKVSGLWLRV